MSGIFAIASKNSCASSLFYGLESSYFRTKFEPELFELEGNKCIEGSCTILLVSDDRVLYAARDRLGQNDIMKTSID